MTGLLSIMSVILPALLHITPTAPSPAGFQEALWSLYNAVAVPQRATTLV